jgi:hypothetical protein
MFFAQVTYDHQDYSIKIKKKLIQLNFFSQQHFGNIYLIIEDQVYDQYHIIKGNQLKKQNQEHHNQLKVENDE